MQEPVKGRISSSFGNRIDPVSKKAGKFHSGVDIAIPIGTSIVSPWDGTVAQVWNDLAYGGGLSIVINHPNGYRTGYAHLSVQSVVVGQKVTEGQIIAKSGNTGLHSTGAHLHFTLRKNGNLIDPKTVFKFK